MIQYVLMCYIWRNSMLKFYNVALMLAVLGGGSLYAASYKGQKIYMNSCKECHEGGQSFASSKKQRDWSRLLDQNGAKLVQIHTESKKAASSVEYFTSKNFVKNVRHLEDFFVEFASDSGNIPACN